MIHRSAFAKLGQILGLICYASSAFGQQGLDVAEDDFLRTVGNNALWIGYVANTSDGRGGAYKQGSAYLVDAHRAVTAAHVVADLSSGQQFVVQVGALRTHEPYLTTGKVLAIDKRRDLALLEIETTAEWAAYVSPTSACSAGLPSDNRVYVAGLAPASTGANGSMHRFLSPLLKHVLTEVTRYPDKTVTGNGDIQLHFQSGDPIVTLAEALNHGDSGGAILDMSGCLLGVVSVVTQFIDGGNAHTVTLGSRLHANDPILNSGAGNSSELGQIVGK